MTNTLPAGWVKTTLGEVVVPSRDRALPAEYPDLPYVGLEHIESHSMKLLKHGFARDVRSSSVRFSRGDVLYGKMRPYLNKVWVADFDGLCSAEFLVFLRRGGVNSHFLALRLNADDFVAFSNAQVSGERPRVDFRKLSHFSVLLPPVAEQQRIVEKLMASLSGIARGMAALGRSRDRLSRYRTAVLDAAISGELTKDWRDAHLQGKKAVDHSGKALLQHLLQNRRDRWEEAESERLKVAGKAVPPDWKSRYPEAAKPDHEGLPRIPEAWAWASAEQLTEATRPISYGVIKLGAHVDNGVPVLRSSDVRPLRLDLSGLKLISKAIADQYHRTYLNGGEVLVTIRGTLGGVASVPPECAGFNISREVAMLALIDKSTATCIAYFIGAPFIQEWLTRRTRGIAYTGINIETLRALPIPLASQVEQIQLVKEIDHRFLAADRLRDTLDRQAEQSKLARGSLLREAFSGTLVAQDPRDEPASVLLKRFRGRGGSNHYRRRRDPAPSPNVYKRKSCHARSDTTVSRSIECRVGKDWSDDRCERTIP